MNFMLAIAFLFYWGAMEGWIIEFFYRNLISHNGPKGKIFINPGFCKGPWLPIYGIGLASMFIISYFVNDIITATGFWKDLMIILFIMIVMTVIEFVSGIFFLKVLDMRLWDYRNEKGNIMGVICPKFSIIWGSIGAVYYLFIHSIAKDNLYWLSQNLSFSFFIGLFFGFFVIDLISSAKQAAAIKKYGDMNDVVVKYEELKAMLIAKEKELEGKQRSFISQIKLKQDEIIDALDNAKELLENKSEALKLKTKSLKKGN